MSSDINTRDIMAMFSPLNYRNWAAAKREIEALQDGGGQVLVVPSGADAQTIQEAHDELDATTNGGYIAFDSGGSYTWNTPVVWEASKVGILGNHALFNNSAMAGSSAVSLTLTSTKGDYPSVMAFRDFDFIGDPTIARDSLQTAIRCHTVTANSDVRVMLENIRVQHQNTALSIGSGAFVTRGFGLELSRSKFGIQQESGATNFAENCAFWGCTIFNNDCHLKLNAGQRIKFYGTSFDYFGTQDGSRTTADDACFNLNGGGHLELFGCHVEFNYGAHAGQTNIPIQLHTTGDRIDWHGGVFYYADSAQQPLFSHWIQALQVFQQVRLIRVGCRALGRLTQITNDDCLAVGSETTHTTGNGGNVIMEDCYSVNNAFADLPSVVGYRPSMSWTRNGADAPYTELSYKAYSPSGLVTAASATSDSGVTPRNGVGSMIKLTGQGIWRFPIPAPLAQRLYPWALFVNKSAAVGTITIKENYTTFALKADGTLAADTRGTQNSANTKSFTGGGTNQWERCSWKDVRGDTTTSARIGGDYNAMFFIDIDTTAMSSGAVFIDDFAYQAG